MGRTRHRTTRTLLLETLEDRTLLNSGLAANSAGLSGVSVQIKQVPNDPDFSLQNNLDNTGQNGGTVGADIHATAAWDVTTGSNSVVIAEMDTGIDYTHPDLYQNIWINQAEIPKSRLKNLVDVNGDGLITFADLNNPINQGMGKIMPRPGNTTGLITAADILAPMQLDANGNDTGLGGWAHGSTQDGDTAHPDDLIGWNFAAASAANNYQGTNNPMDDNGHGTEVAGIMGATGNNGSGVAGVAWQTQIMAVKFMDASGNGDITHLHQGVELLRRSTGPRLPITVGAVAANDPTLYAAIQNAQAAGQIFVVAASNDAVNLDVTPEYPASFKLANIVSVASTDRVDALAGYSNYGTTVSIAAPGENIYTTEMGGNYGSDSGTSMATPEVTGALALVWGEHPTWTYAQVIAQVLDTADQAPYLKGKILSGRLDVAAAVGTPVIPLPAPTPSPVNTQPKPVSSPPTPVTPPSPGTTITVVEPADPQPSNLTQVASGFTHGAEYFTNFINAAYLHYLDRLPDANGLAYWLSGMEQGRVSNERLEAGFIGSAEYIAKHGGTGAGWVTGMYTDLLGRTPRSDEVAYWVNNLNNGESPANVAFGFAASLEREGQRVAADYLTYLDRPLDAPGLAYWVAQFQNGAFQ